MTPATRRQLARFLLVGAGGFALDMSVLALLVYALGFSSSVNELIGSRVVAFLAAIALTFVLNARYTFAASVRQSRFSRYLVIQMLGAGINLGSFSVLVATGPLAGRPLVAMAVGCAVATVSNFVLTRRFVYRAHPGS